MAEQKTILYFEDDPGVIMMAEDILGEKFPNHKLIIDKGKGNASECADRVLEDIGGIEKITIAITDGNLLNCSGWEVIKELRDRGYNGNAVYAGFADLPKEFENLYQKRVDKFSLGSELKTLELNN